MILKRWTEYCSDFYNHMINPYISVLKSNVYFGGIQMEEELPILESEVIEAIKTVKEWK